MFILPETVWRKLILPVKLSPVYEISNKVLHNCAMNIQDMVDIMS